MVRLTMVLSNFGQQSCELMNGISTSSSDFLDTLITKKFGRKNNSDKRVSENLTVQNFRRPKFFTSEIFPELFHRENDNNVYFAITIWRFFTTKSNFFYYYFFFI